MDSLKNTYPKTSISLEKSLKPEVPQRARILKHWNPLNIPLDADPPEGIEFKCGRCERWDGSEKKADYFSMTPPPLPSKLGAILKTHVFEGRCSKCARLFKGQLVEYEAGKRYLYNLFCQKITSEIIDS